MYHWQESKHIKPYVQTGFLHILTLRYVFFVIFRFLFLSTFQEECEQNGTSFTLFFSTLTPHLKLYSKIISAPYQALNCKYMDKRRGENAGRWLNSLHSSLGDHWKLLSWSTNYIDPMQCRLWKAISASLCDLMCKALKHRKVNNWVCSESHANKPSAYNETHSKSWWWKKRMLETILKINVAFTHKHFQDNEQPHNPWHA